MTPRKDHRIAKGDLQFQPSARLRLLPRAADADQSGIVPRYLRPKINWSFPSR
jgi:hypothetical protein